MKAAPADFLGGTGRAGRPEPSFGRMDAGAALAQGELAASDGAARLAATLAAVALTIGALPAAPAFPGGDLRAGVAFDTAAFAEAAGLRRPSASRLAATMA